MSKDIVLGLVRKEITRVWRTSRKEAHNLHYSPNSATVIKSRRSFAGHVGLQRIKEVKNIADIQFSLKI
jgi:hypothetical protein